ncbi:superoxide dismutase [Spirulina sp. CS-785/01]|nr:superoxide dismutase [Spirulina sp. CS-785/01]MDB9313284.1 superoxide dismutase [Spirulina sp. CS-785/01]
MMTLGEHQDHETMAYTLPDLPYDYTALEPHISKSTLEFHHDKHHAAYVKKYNAAIEGTEYANQPIEEVLKAVAGDTNKTGIFNNGAQAWNHSFYWNSMKPNGGGKPSGELANKINTDFGNFDQFVEAFKAAGTGRFGSGWAWLVLDGGTLKVVNTLNAGNPITQGQTPLLTMDVWEHAYYLDYQNQRAAYIDAFVNNLINWDFVAQNFASA